MRVFLTGGTGFIGLALTARLAAQGIDVVSTAAEPPPDWARRALGDGVHFDVLDVRNKGAMVAAFEAARPAALIHAAALTPDAARERAGGSAAIFEVNVAGTANALEAAAEAGITRVMAFSSGAVYGRTIVEVAVLEETTECRPTMLYAISKLAAERAALRLGALRGLSVVTPRLSAAWGPWEYRTPHRQTPSPAFQIVEAVLHGARPQVPDGAALPLVFAEDAADMLVRLLLKPGAEGVFNVGSTAMVDLASLADLAGRLAQETGRTLDAGERPIDLFVAGRPPMSLARTEAAIGPCPRTDLATAMARTLDWVADGPYASSMA